MDTHVFSKYEQYSTPELFEALGTELLRNRLGLNDEQDPESNGEMAYQTYRQHLKSRICKHLIVQQIINSPKAFTRVEIAGAIADSISGYLTGVTLFVVSMLLAREGLAAYCSKEEA